jgi:hypothetical protein
MAGLDVEPIWKNYSRDRIEPIPRTRPRRESKKRRDERAERAAVVYATHERSEWKCEARTRVPEVTCRGELECDERVSRGVYPGAHLDLDVTQSLCHAHHMWRHANPLEALTRGLRSLSGVRSSDRSDP